MKIIADHSGKEPVIVSPPASSLVKTLSKAGPDFIIGENCREAESEPDKSQRKMCLKLNLHSEGKPVEHQRQEKASARRSSAKHPPTNIRICCDIGCGFSQLPYIGLVVDVTSSGSNCTYYFGHELKCIPLQRFLQAI